MPPSAPEVGIAQVNILIIGGTRFQGRYLVNELLQAGNSVTVFHRGSHAIDPRKGLTDIIGDRNAPADLAPLSSYEYDACIDTCAYFPWQIKLLADSVNTKHYSLISSVYVYEDQDTLLREDAQLVHVDDTPINELTPDSYGALKMLCEKAAVAHFGHSVLILRPSIIIGIGDHTERTLFWLRLAEIHGKRIDFAGQEPVVQLVDVRDLAHFTTRCVETLRQGAVNVCGEPVGLCTLLDSMEAMMNRQLSRTSVHMQDLPALDLARLPYCESGRLARHDTTLSDSWGFTRRKLQESLKDIYNNYQRHGFSMHNLQAEEAAVLRLFG